MKNVYVYLKEPTNSNMTFFLLFPHANTCTHTELTSDKNTRTNPNFSLTAWVGWHKQPIFTSAAMNPSVLWFTVCCTDIYTLSADFGCCWGKTDCPVFTSTPISRKDCIYCSKLPSILITDPPKAPKLQTVSVWHCFLSLPLFGHLLPN